MSAPEDLLRAFEDLVRAWSPKLDLVAPGDLDRFRARHVDDSLRLAPLLPSLPAGSCVDVGSGAGLPGVPLAVADRARAWVFLEPRGRRAAFLEEVVRALGLHAEVVAASAADAARGDLGGSFVLATARALAPPAHAVKICAPLLAPGGCVALWHGPGAVLPTKAESWAPGIAIVRR